jgi:hypothetical protein
VRACARVCVCVCGCVCVWGGWGARAGARPPPPPQQLLTEADTNAKQKVHQPLHRECEISLALHASGSKSSSDLADLRVGTYSDHDTCSVRVCV